MSEAKVFMTMLWVLCSVVLLVTLPEDMALIGAFFLFVVMVVAPTPGGSRRES